MGGPRQLFVSGLISAEKTRNVSLLTASVRTFLFTRNLLQCPAIQQGRAAGVGRAQSGLQTGQGSGSGFVATRAGDTTTGAGTELALAERSLSSPSPAGSRARICGSLLHRLTLLSWEDTAFSRTRATQAAPLSGLLPHLLLSSAPFSLGHPGLVPLNAQTPAGPTKNTVSSHPR